MEDSEPEFDPSLLDRLVCPITKTSLEYDAQHQELVSKVVKLVYPIRSGIPIMLPSVVRVIEKD